MVRPLLGCKPASSETARFGVERDAGVGIGSALLLEVLLALLVGGLDQLHFCLLQAESNLIALLDEIVQLRGVARDPNVPDSVTEYLAELRLIKIRGWHRGEENGPGGDAVGVQRTEKESLPQIDVVDALAHDQIHDESEVDPADEDMSVVAVLLRLWVDIAISQDVQLLLAASTGGINGEEDWPGDTAAGETYDQGHLQEAEVEVCVERLVLKSIDIGDLPKGAYPIEQTIG
jgi:hypothetical protein